MGIAHARVLRTHPPALFLVLSRRRRSSSSVGRRRVPVAPDTRPSWRRAGAEADPGPDRGPRRRALTGGRTAGVRLGHVRTSVRTTRRGRPRPPSPPGPARPPERSSMNPYALPATTHSYLARAAESLSEAIAATEVPTRYACAHVAALRAAAALLAARARPAAGRGGVAAQRLGAARRGRARAGGVGPVLRRAVPPSGRRPRRARPARSPSARPTTWSATPTGSSP